MSFSGSSYGRYSRLWLIITGAILLAVGGGMALTLGGIPFAGGTMLLTGGILAAVGIALIVIGIIVGQRAAATDQLLQTGVAGTAAITGLTQTGMYFNENPQVRMHLLVSLPGQTPYATTHTEVVPLILLGRLSSGAPLAVRVDPANLNRLAVDWSSSGFAAGGMPMMGGIPMMGGMPMGQSTMGAQPVAAAGAVPFSAGEATSPDAAAPSPAPAVSSSGMDESLGQVQAAMQQGGMAAPAPFSLPGQASLTVEQLRAYLRQSGVEGTARVDMLEDTGQTVGDERLVRMQLLLNPAGPSPMPLPASAAMVPVAKSHKMYQGMTVPVRYEATNPNLLMVDWDKI